MAAPKLPPEKSPAPKTNAKAVLVEGQLVKRTKTKKNLSLSQFITLTTVFAVFTCSIIIAYFSFEILKDNKFKDTMAIFFLEMDFQSEKIRQELDDARRQIIGQATIDANQTRIPDIVFIVTGKKNGELVRGRLPTKMTFSQLKIADTQLVQPLHVVQIAGREYMVEVTDSFLPGTFTDTTISRKLSGNQKVVSLFAVNILSMIKATQESNYESIVYAVNRDGQLLFSNDRSVTPSNLLKRDLVQRFIDVPIRQGQLRFSVNGESKYGFYSEVRDSNVILFSETPENAIVEKINSVLISAASSMLVILLLTVIAVQYPIWRMTQPINKLLELTTKISNGDFKIKAEKKGFREIGILASAFVDMAHNLEIRDTAISKLVIDKQERARLEREMQIAMDIQQNLLPTVADMRTNGLLVASVYEPAEDVAGDWYGVFHCKKSGNSYYVIADVSGHGTGSSMFTSMIAALFINHQNQAGGFSVDDFFTSLHNTFVAIGKNKWHVTVQMMVFNESRKKVTMYNAGHVFPILLQSKDGNLDISRLQSRSSPLGLNSGIDVSSKTVDVDSGDLIFLYTDGLLERKNDQGKQYGPKRIMQVLTKYQKSPTEKLLIEIRADWERFCQGNKRDDDTCLIAIRVS